MMLTCPVLRLGAEDVVKVQPEGPYLLGGHSYGGAVAVEVALVLESWGHHVALLLVRAAPVLRRHLMPRMSASDVCCHCIAA